MKKASISSLKAKLSQYLEAVKAGQEVLVTDRGTPVARLSPVHATGDSRDRMDRLIRAGLVRAPSVRGTLLLDDVDRPVDPAGASLKALLDERAEGR